MELWREQNRQDLDAPFRGRDRAATAARPLHQELHQEWRPESRQEWQRDRAAGYLEEPLDFSDALAIPVLETPVIETPRIETPIVETPVIVPSARQPVVLPPVKARHTPGWIGIARTLLVSLMLYYIVSSSLQLAGGPALPFAPFPWATSGGASSVAAAFPLRMDGKMASRVRPMTQMRRVDLYDSYAQYEEWGGAACSAASLAEILTAYGLPHMTIGRMIRELGRDISPQWGLLTYYAFDRVVARYGLRADVYLAGNPLTYKQMLYLTNTLGVPVMVNMRATTGYYHFLSGGHILVMTGGDSRTIHLADSSLYYMKSLPLSTYNAMARPRNVVIVPRNFHYTLPPR